MRSFVLTTQQQKTIRKEAKADRPIKELAKLVDARYGNVSYFVKANNLPYLKREHAPRGSKRKPLPTETMFFNVNQYESWLM